MRKSREDPVRRKAGHIRSALTDLARRLRTSEESELLVWVIPGTLACAHRPLRYHPQFGGSGVDLPREATTAVADWTSRVRKAGIQSIICLMHPKEMRHYANLDLGTTDLLDYYRSQDLHVVHFPWDDPAHRSPGERGQFSGELERIRHEALLAYDELPKPALLHCSAGIDRSSPVAAYIFCQRAPG